MSIQEKCRVLKHQEIGPQRFKLTISSAYISSHAQPGQFVNVKCSDDYDPLLRRPLSIHSASSFHGRFELLYEVVGKGTELLRKTSVGNELDILGPLGKGFTVEQNKKIVVLVAGGMGVAPLLFLANNLGKTEQGTGKPPAIYVLLGAKKSDLLLCDRDFKELADQALISTDDGSYGKKGVISDLLFDLLDNEFSPEDLDNTTIYACGPRPMLQIIADISFQKKVSCQISMEAYMACGIGTCLGCVVKTKDGYKKVCDEGPVFKAEEIIWQS
ncbi:MAG: dihydroorotate dehydrogenase electron transfer subunit [Candidatus Saganbacteria bacterium]|nr:dihydroorotate dehydrogenase electron transfer subunit [Candidatus Saganbacteria bacterium]